MGKFYELFNMDAAIGVKELGLIFMKVNNDNCYRVSRYKVLIVSLLIFLMSFFYKTCGKWTFFCRTCCEWTVK